MSAAGRRRGARLGDDHARQRKWPDSPGEQRRRGRRGPLAVWAARRGTGGGHGRAPSRRRAADSMALSATRGGRRIVDGPARVNPTQPDSAGPWTGAERGPPLTRSHRPPRILVPRRRPAQASTAAPLPPHTAGCRDALWEAKTGRDVQATARPVTAIARVVCHCR